MKSLFFILVAVVVAIVASRQSGELQGLGYLIALVNVHVAYMFRKIGKNE